MTDRNAMLFDHVLRQAMVAVIREESEDVAWELGRCYAENGFGAIEVTMTTPGAVGLIARLKERYGGRGVVLAAGTVRSSDDAAAARRAGAEVLVSPHTDLRVIDYASEHGLLCVAGASTPTEIIRAWEAGAGIVKVYPARQLGGPEYIRTIRGPIRDVPMLAGGPIALDEIESYLDAGAVAVNLGASLAPPDRVKARDWEAIAKLAQRAISIVRTRIEASTNPSMVVH
ncbi:MAG: bifunctional 4-hydroxy-2-oxoglutarate aldolase/2-dehydro-3-deoxy-phosphogluconate aldolase [Acidobacteria bacterium]|nr:bifunctional 4-hydroxy-2-oxoglutarate aldolase/2-dehydro-3-deoxy-phosphogluconate aldolase [Acidobacteriota bacterium]